MPEQDLREVLWGMEINTLVLEEGKLFSFTLNPSFFLGTRWMGGMQKYSNVSVENITPVLPTVSHRSRFYLLPRQTEGFAGSCYYRLRRVGCMKLTHVAQ